MNWSFTLWALTHITLWGSIRNLIVAGGILILAFVGSLGQDRKKLSAMGESWRGWMRNTSFVPFGAIVTKRVRLGAAVPGRIPIIGGFLLWLAVTAWHAPSASLLALLPL
jgi:uncharacterized membrane protein